MRSFSFCYTDFVYGQDSTCYRGLTKPTQASLVLALVLASGLVVASPDIHLPSVASLVEGSRHLMGDDAASELRALVERVAFQWDMSGVERYIHDVSDQVALSFNNELLPSSLQLRDSLQEVSTTISERMDVFLAETASRIDLMKYEFTNTMAPTESMINQALVNGKEMVSQLSNEWQLASQHNVDQLNQYVAQASNNIQGEISEMWNKGQDFLAATFASLSDTSQLKIDQLDLNFVPDTSELRAQAIQGLTRSKDAIVTKTMEYQQVGQIRMDGIKTDMLQTNEQLHGLVNQYSEDIKELSVQKYSALVEDLQQKAQSEAIKFQDLTDSVIAPKYLEFQELSQAKLNEIGQNAIHETDNIQNRLIEVGADFEMKGRVAMRDIVSFLQDSGRFLQQQMLAFRDSSLDTINKMKEQIFQDRAAMANIEETLGEWKNGLTNTWSNAEISISNQLAIEDTLQNLKETTKSITDQVSIQNSIQTLKDGTSSLVNQVAVQDTLQELKESAKSISTQVSIDGTLQDLKESTKSITDQISIQDTIQNMKETTKSITDQVSIQDSIQNLKDSTASLAHQVAVQDTLQDLKESAKSISTQVSIDSITLEDLKDSTATALSNAGQTVTNQVGTIIRQPDPVSTDSSLLKSILDDVVY